MDVFVKVKGLAEIQRKLQKPVLLDPAIEEGLNTVGARLERQGNGLGAQRNPIARQVVAMAQEQRITHVEPEFHSPRVTGSSYLRKNIAVFRSMAPRVVRKALQRIQQRWAA